MIADDIPINTIYAQCPFKPVFDRARQQAFEARMALTQQLIDRNSIKNNEIFIFNFILVIDVIYLLYIS